MRSANSSLFKNNKGAKFIVPFSLILTNASTKNLQQVQFYFSQIALKSAPPVLADVLISVFPRYSTSTKPALSMRLI